MNIFIFEKYICILIIRTVTDMSLKKITISISEISADFPYINEMGIIFLTTTHF